MKTSFRAGLALVAVVMGATSVRAALLAPGATLFPAPIGPPNGGVVVDGGVPVPFTSGTGVLTGTLTTTVFAGDPTNTFGGLTFVYSLSNFAASTDSIHRLTVVDFSSVLVDASYAGPGFAPTWFDSSLTGTIGTEFTGAPFGPGPLAPGFTSATLILRTSAASDTPSFANIIDGDVTQVATFAPASGSGRTPEPGTLALIGVGAGLLVRRRKN